MAKYVIKSQADGRVVFTLEEDGKVMLTSDPYTSKQACRAAIALARICSKDPKGYGKNLTYNLKFYFVLKTVTGSVVGTSELFDSALAMGVGIRHLQQIAQTDCIDEHADIA